MIDEGIIIEIKGDTSIVRVTSGPSCSSCGCGGTGVCLTGSSGERVIHVSNRTNARVGDRVIIEINSGTILKSSFIAYMVPLIFLFIGGGIGGWLSTNYPGLGSVDLLASLCGMLFLGSSIVLIYFLNKRPRSVGDFRPVIKAVLQ